MNKKYLVTYTTPSGPGGSLEYFTIEVPTKEEAELKIEELNEELVGMEAEIEEIRI